MNIIHDEVMRKSGQWIGFLVSKAYLIAMTHSCLKQRTAEYAKNTSYKITPQTSGKDFRDKFVSVSPNVVLVVCGHTGKPGDFEDAVANRVDKNVAGRNVHRMMFNFDDFYHAKKLFYHTFGLTLSYSF